MCNHWLDVASKEAMRQSMELGTLPATTFMRKHRWVFSMGNTVLFASGKPQVDEKTKSIIVIVRCDVDEKSYISDLWEFTTASLYKAKEDRPTANLTLTQYNNDGQALFSWDVCGVKFNSGRFEGGYSTADFVELELEFQYESLRCEALTSPAIIEAHP